MRAAANEFSWHLNYGGIASMWRGGCIIRSIFLKKINEAYDEQPSLSNILLAPFFVQVMVNSHQSLRNILAEAIRNGIPTPTLSSALAYYDGYRSEKLPANLLQAQRDFFGAHQYERTDQPRGKFFHTNWTGRGGQTASTIYSG
jgi:6-phosphogluconate dehydrogenase